MKVKDKPVSKRGGKRAGAGRIGEYGEPTSTLCFRVPQTHRDLIKSMVRDYLDGLKTKNKTKKHEPHYGC